MPNPSRRRIAHATESILIATAIAIAALPGLRTAPAHADTLATTPQAPSLKLPPDRVYARAVGPDSAVTFRHATHVEFESNRCTGCHPRLYRILGPSPASTHAVMDRGGSCGSCHDGRHAFGVRAKESCLSCHAGSRPAAADLGAAAQTAPGGPKPFVFSQGGASPGAVTFRHETHRGKSMRCNACHPKLFAMKPLAQEQNADYHDRALCGGCHDGKHGFGVEDDEACGRCHVEGGSR